MVKNKMFRKNKSRQHSAIINIDKDPVSLLHEVFKEIQCNSTMLIGPHNKCCFEVTMQINGKLYAATGPTSKLAKKSTALIALAELCNVYYDPKKVQPHVQVPVPSIDQLLKKNLIIVSTTRETEPEKLLKSLLSNDNVKAIENKSSEIDKEEFSALTIEEIVEDSPAIKAKNSKKNISKLPAIKPKIRRKSKSGVEINSNLKMNFTNSNMSAVSFNLNMNYADFNPIMPTAISNMSAVNSNINMNTTNSNLMMPAVNSNLNMSSTNSNQMMSAVNSNLNMNFTNSNLNMTSPNSNLIMPAVNSNLNMTSPNSNVIMPAVNSNLNMNSTNSNLLMPAVNSNLNMSSTNSNQMMSAVNSNLNMNSTNSNLNMTSPNSNLIMPAVNSNLNMNSTNSNQIMPAVNSNINMNSTNSNLNMNSTNSNTVSAVNYNLNMSSTNSNQMMSAVNSNLNMNFTNSNLNMNSTNPNLIIPAVNSNPQVLSSNVVMQHENDKGPTYQVPIYSVLSCQVLQSTTTTQTTTTMNTTCVRSYARNPLNFEEPIATISNQNNVSTAICQPVNNNKPNLKRQHESSPVSNNLQPPAKKMTLKCNPNCPFFNTKIEHFLKWSKDRRNPIKVLKTLCPGLSYYLESEMGSSHAPFFMMSALINGRKYFGHGKTKLLAKRAIATQILNDMKKPQTIQISETPANNSNGQPQGQLVILQNNNITPYFPSSFSSLQLAQGNADLIEQHVMRKFNQLTAGRQENQDYKVLAGIVMTINLNFKKAMVVAISTGTKCINGGNMCLNGTAINDSHAEVIARRCFMKYLYTQLQWVCGSDPFYVEKSIFIKNPNGFTFTLKPHFQFHLYINTAPCGDARIFSFNDRYKSSHSIAPSFNSAQYGQLRTKVEGDLGTTPIGNNYSAQTWDGIMFGEPLQTMSCSDKIARWNVLGIQGSLLSTLIGPIYLHSIVLGSMLNPQHMYRAICGRIEQSLYNLPQPYRLNRPLLGQTSTPLPRKISIAPIIGINWTLFDHDFEKILQPTGRQIYDNVSSLSKIVFFDKYTALLESLPLGSRYVTYNYAEAKSLALDYQLAKNVLFAAFQHADLGCWIKKPIEQDEIELN